MKNFIRLFTTAVLILSFAAEAHAQSVAELTASRNNTLYESGDGDISNGKGDHIFAGVTSGGNIRRALLYFDLSEIPEGAQIESAELNLVMNRTVSGEREMSIHQMLSDWGEGQSSAGGQEGGGTDATDGDATWLHSFFPDEDWENEGGDFSGDALSSVTVGGSGNYTWTATADFEELVQTWLDNPSENYGLILLGDETGGISAKRFSSRHNQTEGNRPVLLVEYTEMATSSETDPELPASVVLNQNYPNPFNPQTVISFSVQSASDVEITVHDMLGRRVMSLMNNRVQAGRHEVVLDASGLSSGVYIYNLRTTEHSLSRKLTVAK